MRYALSSSAHTVVHMAGGHCQNVPALRPRVIDGFLEIRIAKISFIFLEVAAKDVMSAGT